MKLKFTLLLILLSFVFVKSQNANLLGIITNENNHRIINATIVNLNSNQVFIPNDRGEFLVLAKSGDLLRFVKNSYERYNYKVTEESFQNLVTIVMTKQPKEIEEVKLTYKFKGNLAKDVNYLNLSQQKMQDLKDEINLSLIRGNREAKSQKDFNQNPLPKYQTGAVDFIKPLAYIVNALIPKKEKYRGTTLSKTQFLKELKSKININYYIPLGMSDYDIDRFLSYADERYNLEEKYRGQVNMDKIKPFLSDALKDFKFINQKR